MRAADERIDRLDAALVEIVPAWTMAPVVAVFQAMRGVGFLAATAVVAEASRRKGRNLPIAVVAMYLIPQSFGGELNAISQATEAC